MTDLITDPDRARNSLSKLPKKFSKHQAFVDDVLKSNNDEYILSTFNILNKSKNLDIERIIPYDWEIEYEIFTKYSESYNLNIENNFINYFTEKYRCIRNNEITNSKKEKIKNKEKI